MSVGLDTLSALCLISICPDQYSPRSNLYISDLPRTSDSVYDDCKMNPWWYTFVSLTKFFSSACPWLTKTSYYTDGTRFLVDPTIPYSWPNATSVFMSTISGGEHESDLSDPTLNRINTHIPRSGLIQHLLTHHNFRSGPTLGAICRAAPRTFDMRLIHNWDLKVHDRINL